MAGKRNPSTIGWSHDGKNTDGSGFDPARFGGWQLDINGQPAISVPIGWETDNQYEAPIAALKLAEGDYRATLRLVTKDGISSASSNAVDFEIRKVPNAPLVLAVA